MKRLISFLLALACCALVCSCAKTDPEPSAPPSVPAVGADRLNPLFRITAYEGQSEPETRYYPTQNGVCYLSRTDTGYTCGFFALPNLISNEDLFVTRSVPGAVYDLGEDKALCFAGGKIWFLSLDEGGGISFEKNGKLAFTSEPVFGADGALYYETERFLLTAEFSFTGNYSGLETNEYVVMPKEKLDPLGFVRILCVSADGERLYYAYDRNGETGYAYFGIGYQAESLGETRLDFLSAMPIAGTTKVLFETRKEGKRVFLLRDLDEGTERTLELPAGARDRDFCVDRQGNYLASYVPDADLLGGVLRLYSWETGQKFKEYELAKLAVNPSIILTDDARYLIVGLYDDGTGYEDHGGETVTSIEIGK